MEAFSETGGAVTGSSDPWAPAIGQLGDLLQGINMQGLSSAYRQNIGDLNAEISSQVGGLTAGLTGGKGGRYGGLGTMARNLGEQGEGGRQKYMADIYGLQQQQGEMVAQTQQDLEQDFMTAISNWQAVN